VVEVGGEGGSVLLPLPLMGEGLMPP